MTTRASLNRYAWAAGSLLTLLCGAGTVLGQQDREMDVWKADPSDLSLAVTQVAPALAEWLYDPGRVLRRTPDRQRRGHYCRSQGLRHTFYQPQRHPHDAKYV